MEQTTSLEDKNMAVIHRFMDEVWNQGRETAIDELYVPGGVAEGLGEAYRFGPEAFKLFHRLINGTCEEIRVEILDIIAVGDKVAFRASMDMTHKASRKKVHLEGQGFGTVANSKLVEAWNSWNFLDLIVQLGAVPEDMLPNTLLKTK
jgi:hypothetical protein